MSIQLHTSNVGAASEMIACADLLSQGFDVFRAISPACSCDLVIINGAEVLRVEVRTADNHGSCCKRGRYDILAAVTPTAVIYTPPLPNVVRFSLATAATEQPVIERLTSEQLVEEARKRRLESNRRVRVSQGLPPEPIGRWPK